MSSKMPPSSMKCALIGCGRVGMKHIQAILTHAPQLQLCAIADVDPAAPKRMLRAAGISEKKADRILSSISLYTDYVHMLDDIAPDLVGITTPSGLHFKIASDCLHAGAHILLEKPMAMRSQDASRLFDLAQSNNRLIAMGHIYRYFPLVRLMKDELATETFGRVLHAHVTVRWGHDQAYYDQAAWRGTWENDGGVLMNQCVHALDLIHYLLNTTPVAATAMIARRSHRMEAEDLSLGILEMKNGVLCSIEGTTNTSPKIKEASFFIQAQHASVYLGIKKNRPIFSVIDENGKQLRWRYLRSQLKHSGLIKSMAYTKNPHLAIYADLVDAILHQHAPVADALSGKTSVEAVCALYRSARDKKTITLPLDQPFASSDMKNYARSDMPSFF